MSPPMCGHSLWTVIGLWRLSATLFVGGARWEEAGHLSVTEKGMAASLFSLLLAIIKGAALPPLCTSALLWSQQTMD